MTIHVTEEDIAKGERASCNKCPVALALKRAFPRKTIWVDELSIWLDGDCVLHIPTHPTINPFTWEFDLHGTGQPFSFELEEPADV